MNSGGATPNLPTICVMDASIALTGAFVCARNIARALEGRARVVLVLPDNSRIAPQETAAFAGVYHLPIRPVRRRVGAVLAYPPMLLLAAWRLRRVLRREGAVALLVNDFHMMQGALCRLSGWRGQILTWVRINPAAFGRVLSWLWLRGAAVSSNRVVAVSEHTRATLPPGMKTSLLYDALDPLPAQMLPAVDGPRFVFIGNYIPGKGQDLALEAFAPLAAEFPGAALHFHGGDMGLPGNRAFREGLQARIAELGLEGRVTLHDFARDPVQALDGARAALNFSQSETFSMTVLEAQGAGLPVVATRSGGPQEIIHDGETGFLVGCGDVAAMTDAMRRLALDPGLARQMGAAARARVVLHFAAPAFRMGLLEILSDVMADGAWAISGPGRG